MLKTLHISQIAEKEQNQSYLHKINISNIHYVIKQCEIFTCTLYYKFNIKNTLKHTHQIFKEQPLSTSFKLILQNSYWWWFTLGQTRIQIGPIRTLKILDTVFWLVECKNHSWMFEYKNCIGSDLRPVLVHEYTRPD